MMKASAAVRADAERRAEARREGEGEGAKARVNRAKQLWGAARDEHSPNAGKPSQPDAWKEVTKGVKEARKTIRTGVKMPAPGRRASAVDAPASDDDDEEEESEEEEEVESARQAAVGSISRAKQLWGAARDARAPSVGKPSEPDAWMEVTKGVKEARKTIRTGVKMPAPGRRVRHGRVAVAADAAAQAAAAKQKSGGGGGARGGGSGASAEASEAEAEGLLAAASDVQRLSTSLVDSAAVAALVDATTVLVSDDDDDGPATDGPVADDAELGGSSAPRRRGSVGSARRGRACGGSH